MLSSGLNLKLQNLNGFTIFPRDLQDVVIGRAFYQWTNILVELKKTFFQVWQHCY
jgi:hypothetical protein